MTMERGRTAHATTAAPSAEEEQRRRLETLATNIARCAVEAIAGARELEQLARWLSPAVYRALLVRVQHAERARRVRRVSAARPQLRLLAARMQHEPDAVEGVLVFDSAARSRAVCVRLEPYGSRWRATAVHVM